VFDCIPAYAVELERLQQSHLRDCPLLILVVPRCDPVDIVGVALDRLAVVNGTATYVRIWLMGPAGDTECAVGAFEPAATAVAWHRTRHNDCLLVFVVVDIRMGEHKGA